MKVLVLFKPNKKYDNFQGTRMRKSIKGSLELLNVSHTDSKVDYFEIAHLISPESEKDIDEIKETNAPVVVSALYTEDDPTASYLEYKPNQQKASVLTPKAIKFLNKADMILVPCEAAGNIIKEAGIDKPIYPCFPGVNLSRFDFSKEEEKEIFYRYYREDKNKKLVIAVGEYNGKMEGVSSFVNAAKKCPNAVFYYIGRLKLRNKISLRLKKFIKAAPSNTRFIDVPPDDIYRSALLNADVFMLPGYKKVGVTSIVEAMAAKTQIIARKQTNFEGILEDGVNAHLGEFSETLTSLTRDFLDGKIKPTTTQAYQQICEHSLTEYGNELLKYYDIAIKANINRRF